MSLQACSRPWTEATDFSNIAFSSSLVVNSTTFSTPPAADQGGDADVEVRQAVFAPTARRRQGRTRFWSSR